MENLMRKFYYGSIRPVEQMRRLPPAAGLPKGIHEQADQLEELLNGKGYPALTKTEQQMSRTYHPPCSFA